MKQYRKFFVLLLAALLALTACGGEEKVAAGTSGSAYISQSVPFTSPLDELENVCISGDSLYLLGSVSGGADNAASFSLVRVPLEGGRAETLPAFRPAQLGTDEVEEVRYTTSGGYLRPGADGTVWLTEDVNYLRYDLPEDFDLETDQMYPYITDRARFPVLRQLDSEGNELFFFDGSGLPEALGTEQFYDLWTDGAGTYFVNTGDAVALLNEDGTVRAILEGEGMDWERFVPLGDGRTAIRGTAQSVNGSTILLRVIDTEAGTWAKDAFSVPYDAVCFQSGDREDTLFYYKRGDALYAWRQGAEEPERVMSWSESGVDADNLAAFAFLPDERLAVAAYDRYRLDFDKSAKLTLLTPTDASSALERTVLTLAAYYLDNQIRAEITAFNRTNSSCYISATEYLNLSSEVPGVETDAEFEQATLRMVTDLTVGKVPDIIYLNNAMPARRLEAQGILEDLWPYIEADPELGRDALMTRPLEAMEYKGGLYRIGGWFGIDTVIGRKDMVGDRLTWTYDDLWAVYDTMPEGSAITHVNDTKNDMLFQLVKIGAEYFIDWENGTSFFDGEEFRALLEFCNRFPAERDPSFPEGTTPVGISSDDELAVYFGKQLLLPVSMNSFDAFLNNQYLFHGDTSYVGWPNEAGQVGSVFNLSAGTTLAITAASEHKEEAWSFLRQRLLPNKEVSLKNEGSSPLFFSINRADFERMAELAMTPKMEEKDGVLQEVPREVTWSEALPDGVDISTFDFDSLVQLKGEIYAMTQEEYDQLMELYNVTECTSDYDVNLLNIITEQAGAYFAGDRSLDDTVAAIQSRVGLYLAEL